MPPTSDTIAALATPAGVSAIAVLRVSGSDTERLAREIFGRVPLPRVVQRADYRDRQGIVLDDLLFTFFRHPRSYTGEDAMEISCHGNPFIAQKILEDLLDRGCRAANPGEFTQRAFLNGRMDLSQAEAVMDLIHAQSDRALLAANHQLRGALGDRMKGLTDRLLGVIARVEAYIDFPEEDLPPEDTHWVADEIAHLIQETGRLLATSHYGEMLRGGIKTVIFGAPNAGKSSLLNRLVGRERALVSPEPGTTRDFLEERILLGVHSLRLIDTAGLNPSPSKIERLGMEKTMERLAEADLVLHVVDASGPEIVPSDDIERCLREVPTVHVLNKIDLVGSSRMPLVNKNMRAVSVSALHNIGIDALIARIVQEAEAQNGSGSTDFVTVNARHSTALSRAQESLGRSASKLARKEPAELLASDLRDAVSSFEEVVGKIDSEKMLDRLFSDFCIGK
jgi:tRNA modification GTPase